MNNVKLLLGSHNHIPFGSSDEEFEKAYGIRLKPFIASLYKYPKVPATLHYSGVLLQWIEKHHPEFVMLVDELVNRKQVELLGGGFYEPMMPLLPLTDKIGQVELLTTYLRKKFGKRPRGCWLPATVWEQSLAGTLQTCGMDYVFLEDGQFRAAGLTGAAGERPFVTEDQGKTVFVFPIATRLGQEIGWSEPGALFGRLIAEASSGPERFISIFPESYAPEADNDQAQEEGICRVLATLSRMDADLELTTPSRTLKNCRFTEKAYFSCGAHPRQFLVKYPESNGIYCKMMYTHILINQLRGDKYRKRTAREELWKAQGCDSFQHLDEGGVYRNNVRKAVYGALLDAERITRERGVFIPSVVAFDFDLDGEKEFLFQGTELNCYVKIEGGGVFELDYLPKPWNYLDTLARRKEAYDTGLPVEDDYRRSAFIDRLLAPDRTLKDALENRLDGSRFCVHERYEPAEINRVHHEAVFLASPLAAGPYAGIEILKSYQLKKNTLSVKYRLTNRGTRPERFNFAPQIDLSLAGDSSAQQRILASRSGGTQTLALDNLDLRDLDELILEDLANDLPLSLTSDLAFDAWVLPIRTRCRLDGKITDAYQSTCIMPIKSVILAPEESWETVYRLSVGC